jgi:hypothetical protein
MYLNFNLNSKFDSVQKLGSIAPKIQIKLGATEFEKMNNF